ncbi:hypothetical protein K402DRAFT_223272 [Aulographum hederae CBS 113979]|uniref:Uncharacterized protein n=1 Tax=Aulographum hederae CBS 113979 TaxID=1176131 RepID=A0A6G1GLN3_9PEZI|nr:hypothetical protein K402DRAFT_223272 [Aulographum hederae CBS 113979]
MRVFKIFLEQGVHLGFAKAILQHLETSANSKSKEMPWITPEFVGATSLTDTLRLYHAILHLRLNHAPTNFIMSKKICNTIDQTVPLSAVNVTNILRNFSPAEKIVKHLLYAMWNTYTDEDLPAEDWEAIESVVDSKPDLKAASEKTRNDHYAWKEEQAQRTARKGAVRAREITNAKADAMEKRKALRAVEDALFHGVKALKVAG